jgi:nitrous oxidase accessory protein NosD
MLVSPQFSVAQKREVTTYLVTPRDRGSLHCSIQQAIDKADPYSRIVLACGQYFESVTLQQPLEIVGEEGAEMPEISARGVCLSLLGDVETYFENVRFTTKVAQFTSKAAARGSASQTSVRITGGRPTFLKCAMTSLFVGGDAVPTVTKCTIQGNVNGSGLTVAENGAGEFSDNIISNHLPFAVHVKSRQSPLFQGNTIFQDPKFRHQIPADQYVESQGGAVLISQDSLDSDDVKRSIAPRFVSNRIGDEVAILPFSTSTFESLSHPSVALNGDFEQFFTERRTVVVDSGCSPYFEDNTITGGHVGVSLGTGCSGTFSNNTISHSSVIGVVSGALSTTVVRFNVISHCATGIFAQSTSAALTQNSVKENIGSGLMLLIGPEDSFHMEGNSFVGNDVGICIRPSFTPNRLKGMAERSALESHGAPGALLEKNYVCSNKSAGIAVCGDGFKVTLRDIEIGSNGKFGAYCSFGAAPVFDNVRFDRGTVGVLSERSANPQILNCHFTGQSEAAIVARDRGLGHFSKNAISGFTKFGILVDDGGSPNATENNIASTSGTAIAVTHGGTGQFWKNRIDMVATGLSISSYGDPLFWENQVSSCTEMGVHIFDEGCGTIISNTISACAVGVGCSLGGEGVVRANVIKACTRFGLIASEGSQLVVEKNSFEGNIGGNILLEGRDCVTLVRKNHVSGSSGFGVRSCREAGGDVIQNICSNNRDGGIGSETLGNTTFKDNVCRNERGPGIVIKPHGKGLFTGNRVENGEGVGAELHPQSHASLEDCVFSRNLQCGVLLHNACGGHVRRCSIEGNRASGIEFHGISCIAACILEDLVISGNVGEGLRILDHCALKLSSSTITHHDLGVYFQCSGPSLLEHCTIENNRVGARFEKGGVATVMSSTFRSQGEADVSFSGEGSGFVKTCILGEGSDVGVLGSYNGGGDISDCKISSAISAGIKLLKNCFIVVRNSRVEQCAKFGVLCEGMCQGTVKNCHITGCREGNVKLLPFASPTILSCTITASHTSGIIIESRSGRIEDNTIHENLEHGILFDEATISKDSKEPMTRGSTNRRRSVATSRKAVNADVPIPEFAASSDIVCMKNTIKKNNGAGVYFSNGTSADLFDNDIHMNSASGVVVGSGCTPTIGTGNRIHRNSESGIILMDHSSATVSKSKVFQNDPCNLELHERSGGSIVDCEVMDATVDGMRTTDSISQIRACKISGCAQGSGILLQGPNKHLQVIQCEITGNGVGVCADTNGASAQIRNNVFRHNVICGIKVENGGCPEMVDNTFEQGTLGVMLRDGAGGVLLNNTFGKNAEAVSITGSGIATICKENAFSENDKGIVLRQTDNTLVLEQSIFGPSESAAISCEDGAKGTIRDNKFCGGNRGVLIAASAAPIVTSNTFEGCRCGVELIGRSAPKVEKNHFTKCDVGCRSSTTAAGGVLVSCNVFHACSIAGVLTEKQSLLVVSRNIFTDCSATPQSCGVLSTDGGAGTFAENDFHNNSIAVMGTANGLGEFARCMFHDNRQGCVMEHNARTSFERCTFFNNSLGDVLSRIGGAPLFRNCFFSKGTASIQLLQGGAGTFTANMFRDSQTAFVIEDAGAATASNNFITNCAVGVLLRKAPARGLAFTKNVITSCDVGIHGMAGGGAILSQNFVTQGEIGVIFEKKSQLKLTHNTFHKLTKTGVSVKGNGNTQLANNIVQDCGTTGMSIVIPGGSASPADADVTPIVISENYFVGSRTNIQVISGEAVMRKNHVQRGDFGMTVLPEAKLVLDGNVFYDGMRASFTMGSRQCTLSNNVFYSLSDGGAFETSHDANPILSKDNSVYNSCSCKFAPPPTLAPAKQIDVEAFRAKDVLGSLQTALLPLHTTDAPDCGHCGCTAIPGSHERRGPPSVTNDPLEATGSMSGLDHRRSTASLLKKVGSSASLLRRRRSSVADGDLLLGQSSSVVEMPPTPPPRGPAAAASFRRQSNARK